MKEIASHVAKAAKAVARGRGKGGSTGGAEGVLTAAYAAARRGAAEAKTAREVEGYRRTLAGDLPEDGVWRSKADDGTYKESGHAPRKVTSGVVNAVKAVQRTAARLRAEWYEAAKREIARRSEEEAMQRWVGPVFGEWAKSLVEGHEGGGEPPEGEGATAEVGSASRAAERAEGTGVGQAEAGREGQDAERGEAAATAGPRGGNGLSRKGRARGGRRREGEGEGRWGWTIVRAVIAYKRREAHLASVRRPPEQHAEDNDDHPDETSEEHARDGATGGPGTSDGSGVGGGEEGNATHEQTTAQEGEQGDETRNDDEMRQERAARDRHQRHEREGTVRAQEEARAQPAQGSNKAEEQQQKGVAQQKRPRHDTGDTSATTTRSDGTSASAHATGGAEQMGGTHRQQGEAAQLQPAAAAEDIAGCQQEKKKPRRSADEDAASSSSSTRATSSSSASSGRTQRTAPSSGGSAHEPMRDTGQHAAQNFGNGVNGSVNGGPQRPKRTRRPAGAYNETTSGRPPKRPRQAPALSRPRAAQRAYMEGAGASGGPLKYLIRIGPAMVERISTNTVRAQRTAHDDMG